MFDPVLVLNRHFSAIAVTDWQRALGLVYCNRALVVAEDWRTYDFVGWLASSGRTPGGAVVRTPKLRIGVPEVIALKLFGLVPRREVSFTRRNIFQHYGSLCCYCGAELPPKKLNLDHVIPRSRGGRSDWSNVVPSCIPCNKRKGDRLPFEAGMELRIAPSRPKPAFGAAFFLHQEHWRRPSWKRFLPSRLRGWE